VSIVGYGEESNGDDDGKQYWIGRASWGDYWGYHGFFRIARGSNNNLGIESHCYWAIPQNRTCEIRDVNDTKTNHCHDPSETIRQKEKESRYITGEELKFATKWDKKGVPNSFRWDMVNGTSFLTPVRNQNVPNYCLSDWAFAVTSMMSDRLNIERIITNKTSSWPEIMLSVQSLLNQPGGQISANCYGCGDLHSVMKFIANKYVPIESCQLYLAADEGSSNVHECEYCNNAQNIKQCEAMNNFTAYTFEKWDSITGESNMKEAIYEFGPIVCGMDATPQFKQYNGVGIFEQFLFTVNINHYVEVIGWGELQNNGSSQPYWIGKNSWGSYWGNQGLFKIQMNTNNLGIETDCFYAIPKLVQRGS